jgi:hypothetical protein
MDETQGPGHPLAPGLLKDYCQIFNWRRISASIEAVSLILNFMRTLKGSDWQLKSLHYAKEKRQGGGVILPLELMPLSKPICRPYC